MSRKKNPVLNEKHIQALALIEKGQHTLDHIAKEVGWKPDYLYELYEGDTSKAGSVAATFVAEVRKIDKRRTQKVKDLTKTNKSAANELISRILEDLRKKKYLTLDEKKLVATMMNCIAKASPNVEIGNLSYSYATGLNAEQLFYEFKRLQSLAGGPSHRGSVQEIVQGRAGALPSAAGPGSEMEEEQ